MDEKTLKRIKELAIINRLKYGKANEKAVIGKLLAECPELKKNIHQLLPRISSIVLEVNNSDITTLKNKVSIEEKGKKEEKLDKLRLPNKPSKVVMRFAPNPNGPATLGSARGIIINHELARKYNGKFILRFDDTDPRIKRPLKEAYDWYLQDCKWLGCEPDEIYYASERIPLYYRFAEKLIEIDKAYVCFCSREEFKHYRSNGLECPHRDQSVKENLEFWKGMLSNAYEEGECVLRIKTDMQHKDPAVRDWVAFRIIKNAQHPKVGSKFEVWPTLDFESAIEDKLLGITHILRGKDLIDSEKRQRYIYNYLGWKYPKVIHWGRIKLEEFGKFSTSLLRKGIEEGKYLGWDDPKLPTLLALRRRGITAEAIKRVMLSLGISDTDISLSIKNIYAENRKLLDSKVNRYFFVSEPRKLKIHGICCDKNEIEVKLPLHPSFPERGYREHKLKVVNGSLELYISTEDSKHLKIGEEIRLMNLFNIVIEDISREEIKARWLKEKNMKVKKIQWLSDGIKAKIIKPNAIDTGLAEHHCLNLSQGEIIQFERYGFCRLDSIEENGKRLVFYFAHK